MEVKLNPKHGSEADRLAKRQSDSGPRGDVNVKQGDGPTRVIHHVHHSGSQTGHAMDPLDADQEGSE